MSRKKVILITDFVYTVIKFLNKNKNIQSSLGISDKRSKFKKNIDMSQAAAIHIFSSDSSSINIKKISIENLYLYVIDAKKNDYKNNKKISRFALQGGNKIFSQSCFDEQSEGKFYNNNINRGKTGNGVKQLFSVAAYLTTLPGL